MILAAVVSLAIGPCGDPMMVSDSYRGGPVGTVRRVIDGRTFELAADNGKTHVVTLAGVRLGKDRDRARAELERVLVGQRVLTLLHGDEPGRRFTARVSVLNFDVALRMIRLGVLDSEESRHLTHFENCEYRHADGCGVAYPKAVPVDGDVKMPVALHREEPPYAALTDAGFRCGDYLPMLEYVVDERGNVACAKFIVRPGSRAVPVHQQMLWEESMRKWRFEPATREGRAVAVRATLTVNIHCR